MKIFFNPVLMIYKFTLSYMNILHSPSFRAHIWGRYLENTESSTKKLNKLKKIHSRKLCNSRQYKPECMIFPKIKATGEVEVDF